MQETFIETDALDAARLLVAEGRPRFERRLTDKLLLAYNQAYAQGETRLAERLRTLLEEAEAAGRRRRPDRRRQRAGRQADLWTAFCDARELYRQAAEVRADAASVDGTDDGRAATRKDATLELMRIAYLRWYRAI